MINSTGVSAFFSLAMGGACPPLRFIGKKMRTLDLRFSVNRLNFGFEINQLMPCSAIATHRESTDLRSHSSFR